MLWHYGSLPSDGGYFKTQVHTFTQTLSCLRVCSALQHAPLWLILGLLCLYNLRLLWDLIRFNRTLALLVPKALSSIYPFQRCGVVLTTSALDSTSSDAATSSCKLAARKPCYLTGYSIAAAHCSLPIYRSKGQQVQKQSGSAKHSTLYKLASTILSFCKMADTHFSVARTI